MKHLFIINPAAGKSNRSVEFTKKIAAFCKPRGLDYDIQISRKKGDCTAIARKAAQSGEEYRIYACGGDGTLNEVINGAAGCPNVAVTNVPGGSGNDFNRAFSDPAAFSDLSRLAEGPEMEVDLISVNGGKMYAVNICSMGIDARIGVGFIAVKTLATFAVTFWNFYSRRRWLDRRAREARIVTQRALREAGVERPGMLEGVRTGLHKGRAKLKRGLRKAQEATIRSRREG